MQFSLAWTCAAIFAIGAQAVAASEDAAAAVDGDDTAARPAILRIDPDPLHAQLEVREEAGASVGSCSGACTLSLGPGTYSVYAGLWRSELVRAPKPVSLGAGDDRSVHVDVRENALRFNLVLGGLLVGATGLAIGTGMMVAESGLSPTWDGTSTTAKAFVLVGAGSALLAFLPVFLMPPFDVRTHDWESARIGGVR